MPNKTTKRTIRNLPRIHFFNPGSESLDEYFKEELTFDELEALRLKHISNNGEGISQLEGAKKMGISQATFQRLLVSAHKKITKALVHGKAIHLVEKPTKRTIQFKPKILFFNPHTTTFDQYPKEELTFDELEAMRLTYIAENGKEKEKGMSQLESANLMNISQTTFHRTLERGNKKITRALVKGKSIHLIGIENSRIFYYGYGCLECDHEDFPKIDGKQIPLEPTHKDLEKILPLKGVNCMNSECNSPHIYHLARDVMR